MSFKPFSDQSYETIKNACLSKQKLFKDKLFPANETSLFKLNPIQNLGNVSWKRPSEFVENPEFIVRNIDPNDLDQGQIGDCWLIASCAGVATQPDYFNIVVPSEQTFAHPDYAGIFHFRIWQFGEWFDVVVDDLLPVDENNKLVFCSNNKDTNEMWGPLLEKAFAKLNGCYEFLDGGDAIEAMIDMTGGVSEAYKIRGKQSDDGYKVESPGRVWSLLFNSYCVKSLMGASIDVVDGQTENRNKNDLVTGHAYCVLEVVEIFPDVSGKFAALRQNLSEKSRKDSLKLLRMRNPWGESKSWNGAWCATSELWSSVDDAICAKLGVKNQSDGQFFISFDDFALNFDVVEFVHVNMNAFNESMNDQYKWSVKTFNGEFMPVEDGNLSNEDFFLKDPQFCVEIKSQNSAENTLIVSLMQTEQVRKRMENYGVYEMSNEPIAFSIHKLKKSTKKKSGDAKYNFGELDEIESTGLYLSQREITKRVDLQNGTYVIRPSIFEAKSQLKFFLRIFIEGELTSSSGDNIQVNFLNVEKVVENNEEIIENNEEDALNAEEEALNEEEEEERGNEEEENVYYGSEHEYEKNEEGIFYYTKKNHRFRKNKLNKEIDSNRKIRNSRACSIM